MSENPEEISSLEFIRIWLGNVRKPNDEGTYNFDDIQVNEDIFIDKGRDIYNLSFNNCKLRSLTFKNIEVGDIIINKNSVVESINLINSKIKKLSVQESCIYVIKITGGSKTSDIYLNNSEVNKFDLGDNSSIKFFNANFKTRIHNFYFNENSSSSDVEVSESDVNYFQIKDSEVGAIRILNASTIGKINIGDSTTKNIRIHDSTTGDLWIYRNTITSLIEISKSYMPSFNIGNCRNTDDININNSKLSELNVISAIPINIFLNETSISTVNFIKKLFPKDSILQFDNCFINEIRMESFRNFGFIYFKNMTIIEVKTIWQKGETLKSPVMDEKEFQSKFTISNSELGKTSFIGCDLSKFNRFEFYNSKIIDVFVAGTIMPKSIYLPYNLFEEKIDKYAYTFKKKIYDKLLPDLLKSQYLIKEEKKFNSDQKRLAYNQFKKIYEARGDTVSALEYKAKELEVYREWLLTDKNSSNRAERFNLWVHKNTSNYGTNWWMALWKMILLAMGCYLLYCICLGNYPGNNVGIFWEKFSYFPEFFNPIHRADTLEEKINEHENINGLLVFARFWNYASRLIIGFMVYQTIQAFRKHGRSSN